MISLIHNRIINIGLWQLASVHVVEKEMRIKMNGMKNKRLKII